MRKILFALLLCSNVSITFAAQNEEKWAPYEDSRGYPIVLDPIVVNTVANCSMANFTIKAENEGKDPANAAQKFTRQFGIANRTSSKSPNEFNATDELVGPAIYFPVSFANARSSDRMSLYAVGYNDVNQDGKTANSSMKYKTTLPNTDKLAVSSKYSSLADYDGKPAISFENGAMDYAGFAFSPYTPVSVKYKNYSDFTWLVNATMKCNDGSKYSSINVSNKQTPEDLSDSKAGDGQGSDRMFTNVDNMAFASSDYQYQPLVFMIVAYGDSYHNHAFSIVAKQFNDLLRASCGNSAYAPKNLAFSDSTQCSVNLLDSKYQGISDLKTDNLSFPFFSQFKN